MVLNINWAKLYQDSTIEAILDHVYHNYVDVYYIHWVLWVFYPLILSFILPICILVFLYASALFLQLYRLRQHLRDAYNYSQDIWNGARHILATLWMAQGRIWHGKIFAVYLCSFCHKYTKVYVCGTFSVKHLQTNYNSTFDVLEYLTMPKAYILDPFSAFPKSHISNTIYHVYWLLI